MATLSQDDTELAALTASISQKVRAADDRLIDAALELAKARARFENGEFASTTWSAWTREALGLSDRRVRELLRVGQAADPAVEFATLRGAGAARQAKHRVKAALAKAAWEPRLDAPVAPEPASPVPAAALRNAAAERLVAWVQTASDAEIKSVLDYIERLTPAPSR